MSDTMNYTMTYIRCELCDGAVRTGNLVCKCAGSSTPGLSPTGLTMGQIARALAAEVTLKQLEQEASELVDGLLYVAMAEMPLAIAPPVG